MKTYLIRLMSLKQKANEKEKETLKVNADKVK